MGNAHFTRMHSLLYVVILSNGPRVADFKIRLAPVVVKIEQRVVLLLMLWCMRLMREGEEDFTIYFNCLTDEMHGKQLPYVCQYSASNRTKRNSARSCILWSSRTVYAYGNIKTEVSQA